MRVFDFTKSASVDAMKPERSTEGSAGYDFRAPCDIIIKPYGFSKLIPLDIKAYMNKGEELDLYIRSSLAIKRKLSIVQGTAIIDSDYVDNPSNEGNIGVMLENKSHKWQRIKKGDKIIQGIFRKYLTTDDDKAKGERVGGYGSTGK